MVAVKMDKPQCGWIFETLFWMKKAGHKRIYVNVKLL